MGKRHCQSAAIKLAQGRGFGDRLPVCGTASPWLASGRPAFTIAGENGG